jgi:hypothetical protein
MCAIKKMNTNLTVETMKENVTLQRMYSTTTSTITTSTGCSKSAKTLIGKQVATHLF